MKILELTLENFTPILSGTGKERIHIDLTKFDDLITVFIGKIGSGKTYILSHLQPFATVGTLDIRNQDDPIIPEKDGKKVIIYQKDTHVYTITHEYRWTGKTHSTKSYIEKDCNELNENGNVSSFKEIIQLEFGIDQGFLRLIRLGPNVINFINMKATERKSYIASLLESTEMYLLLHKYWMSDLREVTTKATVLMNKLNQYGVSNLSDVEDKYDELQESIMSKSNKLTELTKEKYELEAENKSKLNGLIYADFQKEKERLQQHLLPECQDELQERLNRLNSYKDYPDILEVNKQIGSLDQKLSSLENELQNLELSYSQEEKNCNNLKDRKAITMNEEHMKLLQQTYQDLLEKDAQYKKELQGFRCEYSSTFLTTLLGDLNTINILINEISQYDTGMVKQLMQSDSSVIAFAQKKVEVIGYRKLKLQKMINNLKFSESYEPSSTLYFPPFCPTKTCPYYKTHPVTLQKKNKTMSEMEQQVLAYQNEIKDLDVEIYKYSDYPMVYSKITNLKMLWKKAEPILSSLHALKCTSLLQIVTNLQYQGWYNYDKIVDTIDLVEKRNQYFELTEKIKTIKNELNELELSQDSSIDAKILESETNVSQLASQMEQTEKLYVDTKEELQGYNTIYLQLSEKTIEEAAYAECKQRVDEVERRLKDLLLVEDSISVNVQRIQTLDIHILELSNKIKDASQKADSIKTIINDIKFTNDELNSALDEKRMLTYMVDAVSSKKGIPLVMIELFLDRCRDIVNELIYDVCEDDLEILPFKINETEFKIPYMVNGQKIDDISKASQGQSSIVSTAMSFALVRQTGSTDYNIPLLDEMDGPLHKTDKQKFIAILLKHLKEIGSEQCFVITHDDNTFDGYPVGVIMTTDENVNQEKYTNIIRL